MHTILVVESSCDFSGMLAATLRGQGRTVMSASSALEAYHLLRLNKPDAVILNLAMPGGPELLPMIRSVPGCETLPIIGMSEALPPEVVQRAERMGVRTLLAKAQFSVELVQQHVDEVLRQADSAQSWMRGAA